MTDRTYALAGSLTKGGSHRVTILADAEITAGFPVKEVNGKAVVMATGDLPQAMIGIAIRPTTPWGMYPYPRNIEVCSEGFIQVPMTADETPARGQPVYWNPTAGKFTTAAYYTTGSGTLTYHYYVPVRAVFASDGQKDGCAEIQVVPYVPTPDQSN